MIRTAAAIAFYLLPPGIVGALYLLIIERLI